MRVKNLTSNIIKIKPKADTNLVFSLHPSGLARVKMQYMASDNLPVTFGIADIPIETMKSTHGEVTGLPEPEDNTVYIVPMDVARAVPDRKDVYAPDGGSTAVRDDNGDVLYVTRLIQYGNPYQERIAELEQSIEDSEEAAIRREEYERRKAAEDKRLRELSDESQDREIERLEQEKWDLQDQLHEKDHVWGASRR